MRDLSTLTAADFEALEGEVFQLSETAPGGSSVDVRLAEVLCGQERPGHRQPFVLHFLGPNTPVLYQGLHRLSHPGLGELECLIGPVISDAPGITYEAVFS
jgi:hypothetical protein